MVTQMNDLKKLSLPDAPHIPGLVFRGFRGEQDYPKMVAVILGSKDADKIERVESVKDVARNYSHLVNCDPYLDMIFAELDGHVIGYNRVTWRLEENGSRIYVLFGFLLPEWRRRGIGSAMLRGAENRLRAIAAGHSDGNLRFFESFAADSEVGCIALLEREGYKAVRNGFSMVRSDLENIPNLPLPAGLEIRPVQPEHLATIRQASLDAFRGSWGFSEDTEPTVEQMKEDPNYDPSLWKVTWDGEQVAGMVLSFINRKENQEYHRKRGYTEDISVGRPWRRRGLAKSLIAESLKELKRRGMQEAALGVDSQNETGALHLYESMGYRQVKRFSNYRKSI